MRIMNLELELENGRGQLQELVVTLKMRYTSKHCLADSLPQT